QHWGWARPADRLEKFYRYKKLDPKAQYGIKEQYQSILDPKPNLIRWQESD
ncbi:MAG TPA: glycosyl transferase family 2, partial [Negativicutes bacterium]